MADEDDLQRLKRGELDMARCDLRGAELASLALPHRDFDGAHLEGANFDGAILDGSSFFRANMNKMSAQNAKMRNIRAASTVFHGVNLQAADLEGADLKQSHITKSDFSFTNLRGVDFSGCVINEGAAFEGSVVDESTKFDGVSIFRPLARLPAFRFYRVERGTLVRNDTSSMPELPPNQSIHVKGIQNSANVEEIEQRISQGSDALILMALSLAAAVEEQIKDMDGARPNDPHILEIHDRYVDFLRKMVLGLQEIARAIDKLKNSAQDETRRENITRASAVVQRLANDVEDWWESNSQMVVGVGFRTSLLCAGTGLLALCGVPAWVGVFPAAAMVSGKTPLDGLKAFNLSGRKGAKSKEAGDR